MRLLIVGASQGTGALCVKTALDRGHTVTAFARHPERLGITHDRLALRPGDFHDPQSIGPAVAGQDAVVVTASSTSLRGFKQNPRYFSQGTSHVIEAMRAQGARRLVILSALGVGESRALVGFLADKLILSLFLRLPFEDHARQEELVKSSGLDWVIARPGRLTNGPARGKYVRTAQIAKVPGSISRADLADFLVQAAEVDTWIGKAVQLGG